MQYSSNLINKNLSIKKGIEKFNKLKKKFLIVIDDNNKIFGTITDGDLRRSILKKKFNLSEKIEKICNKNFYSRKFDLDKSKNQNILRQKKIIFFPVVKNNKIIKIEVLNEKKKNEQIKNKILILAGGKGLRLRPLTDKIPKPLLMIKKERLLKKILDKFYEQGFNDFEISVKYLKSKIINYLSHYSKKYNIKFIHEKKYLGTIGSLAFVSKTKDPIIVINGDLITKVKFKDILESHNKKKADITICAKSYNYSLPYGEIQFRNKKFFNLIEKPNKPHLINSGIYVINPEMIKFLKKNKPKMMNSFIEDLKDLKKKINVFPFYEDWTDIGSKQEYFKNR